MKETALLIFTLCLQAAIGSMIFITIAKRRHQDKQFKAAVMVTAGLSIIGVLASLLHLGQPLLFLNSLSHLGGSWLSNEAFLSGIFMGIAVLYALVLYFRPGNEGLAKLFRWAGSIVGLITVFAMSKVYTTTSVPVWQGIDTYVDFFATTIALGALLFMAAGQKELASADKRLYSFVILAAVILQAASTVPHALSLDQGGMAAQASAGLLAGMSGIIGLKWLFILGGAGLLLWPVTQTETKSASAIVYAAYASLVVGQIIGRYVFYAALIAVHVGLT
jgi:anaerobic dimethyl sulfoxide reductase subunit C (anchor subunit)